jgi:hypothetical protein
MKIGQVVSTRNVRRASEFDDRFLLPGLDVETFVEKHRPRTAVSRLTGLYMVQRPQCLNIAGASDKYTYEVSPVGRLTLVHWGWFAEILGIASSPFRKAECSKTQRLKLAKKYAVNYWRGIPSKNRGSGFWEWLGTEFVVVQEWRRRGGIWRRVGRRVG